MENFQDIQKKVNVIFRKISLLSSLIIMVTICSEYFLLTTSNYNTYSLGCMILSISLASVLSFTLWNVILIFFGKSVDATLAGVIMTLFMNFLSYIVATVFFIKKGFHPRSIWMTVLGVVVTLIIFIIAMCFISCEYSNIFIMHNLKRRSKEIFYLYYNNQYNVDEYNEKRQQYNELNERINNVGNIISEKYKFKEIKGIINEEIPQFDINNIHIFKCKGAKDYLKKLDNYQDRNILLCNRMEEQVKYMDSVIEKKSKLLKEAERNAERINNPNNIDRLKELFKSTTRLSFRSLKQKLRNERKIKTIGRR